MRVTPHFSCSRSLRKKLHDCHHPELPGVVTHSSSHKTHLQIDMLSAVVRMSPMETRHAREDRRHDHAITILRPITCRYRLHIAGTRRIERANAPRETRWTPTRAYDRDPSQLFLRSRVRLDLRQIYHFYSSARIRYDRRREIDGSASHVRRHTPDGARNHTELWCLSCEYPSSFSSSSSAFPPSPSCPFSPLC